ncbi:hypothetical protein OC846_003642 [Tilletia horrida]|uniref:Uncharacterized protein n=1 Tax=Tilletia horrida TaxID=155126 RepID=A0AAN6JTP6_9BASI|nr:hypothetical protein OC845_004282 [Tilletia horrida]KAK0550445.1 hypothetical protein OC846_003642 [Tilletia horrida]KAK0564124.1 hypothetical protein OC861_004475 [Tilletia horrida]
MSDTQRLPMEIILHIIGSIIDNPRAIYSRSDDVTKTLLSFTRVCQATYAHASDHLRRQCMLIEDERQLCDCITYLKATSHRVPEYGAVKTDADNIPVSQSGVRLCPITSLCLTLTERRDGQSNYLRTMGRITELLTLVRPNLTRLILDISLEVYSPDFGELRLSWSPEVINASFRSYVEAFSSLKDLEEVVNLRDTTFFPSLETSRGEGGPVWIFWPNLRRFALLDAETDVWFWQDMRRAERLELLILGRAFWKTRNCFKTSYLEPGPSTTEATRPHTSLKVVLAASPQDQPRNNSGRCLLWGSSEWPAVDPDNLIMVSLHDLPPPAFEARSPRSETHEHMRTAALRDEIWDWQGEIVS